MVLYHGSPNEINDQSMATGTYFTDNINIAYEYGQYIYSIEVTERLKNHFTKDILNEHWISRGHIPLYMFDVLNNG